MNFIQLKYYCTKPSQSCVGSKCLKFSPISWYMYEKGMKNTKYHHCTNFILWFYAVPVQIRRMWKKYEGSKKITKYIKLSYNCPKFEYVVCRDVVSGWKTFGGQKIKKKLACLPWAVVLTHGKPTKHSASCSVAVSCHGLTANRLLQGCNVAVTRLLHGYYMFASEPWICFTAHAHCALCVPSCAVSCGPGSRQN
jgi:hypothetical protein